MTFEGGDFEHANLLDGLGYPPDAAQANGRELVLFARSYVREVRWVGEVDEGTGVEL